MCKIYKIVRRWLLTEFEEITLKKIIKNKMVEDFYVNLNVLLGSSGIKNKELSSKIGWDAAGYNQKLNRRSDLKLSTLIYMCVALMDLMDEKNQTGYTFYEKCEELDLTKLFTMSEFRLGELFLNVSGAVAGTEQFLDTAEKRKTFKSLKTFVLGKKHSPALSEKEISVYMNFYNQLP